MKNNLVAGIVLGGALVGGVTATSAFAANNSTQTPNTSSTSTAAQGGEQKTGDRDAKKTDHMEALAKSLGVTTDKLKTAMDSIHKDRHSTMDAERKASMEKMAKELGVTVDKLQSVMEPAKGEARGHGRPDHAALAKKLGVTEAKLKEVMEANRPTPPNSDKKDLGQEQLAKDLAKALGLDEAKVKTALEVNRPSDEGRRGPDGPGGRFGDHHKMGNWPMGGDRNAPTPPNGSSSSGASNSPSGVPGL